MKCGQTDKTAQEFCCQDDFKETTIYFCLYTSKKYVERVNVTWYCDSVAFYEVFSYPYHFISRQLKVESLHREFPSFSGSFRRIYWKILASKDHESKEFIATGGFNQRRLPSSGIYSTAKVYLRDSDLYFSPIGSLSYEKWTTGHLFYGKNSTSIIILGDCSLYPRWKVPGD
jgi:hypothetical protein